MDIKDKIRDVPDFPKEGILFKDITPLLQDPDYFKYVINQLLEQYKDQKIDIVVGTESRGFLFGPILAQKLGVGFAPIRKKGKLPYNKVQLEYDTEYSTDCIEIHEDAIKEGNSVLVIDDLLATGGTGKASAELVEKVGGKVASIAFIIELGFLNGREKLKGYDVFSLVTY